jgi:hypothetical protein
MSEEVCVLRDFEKAYNIDSKLFSSEIIDKAYGDKLIDVIT